jgi:transcriptional regulator with XRE-family HTH domain
VPPIKPRKLDPVDFHVGSRVRSLRIQMKMSQTDLADSLGITFQQIQKYEKGTNRISSSRLHQIAAVFGVAPTHFFESPLTEPAHNDVDVNGFDQFCASRDGVALMRAFVRIKNEDLRHAIAKMAEELVE